MKMETIKISVEVSVNLSENTQTFIKSLFTNIASAPQPKAVQASAPQASAPQPKAVQASAPQPKAVQASAPQPSNKTIEDVRAMLANKVNEHRDEIKQKLNEFGAPSVTKLDPSKYDEMFNFLESL